MKRGLLGRGMKRMLWWPHDGVRCRRKKVQPGEKLKIFGKRVEGIV